MAQVLAITPLLSPVAPEYFGMTFSNLAPLLRELTPASAGFAMSATDENGPVGLAVGRMGPERHAEILSLYVKPDHWRRGVGTRLFQAIENAAEARGAAKIHLTYTTPTPAHAALERILARLGWPPPRPHMLLAQITPAIVEQAGWTHRLHVTPPYTLFPWGTLTERERSGLEACRSSIPPVYWPFAEDLPCDDRASLGLKREGEVIGWMLTHRVAPLLTRFTTLYVRHPWQRAPLTFALLAAAMRQAAMTFLPEERAALAVRMDNAPMLRTLKKQFRPHACLWQESRYAEKTLA